MRIVHKRALSFSIACVFLLTGCYGKLPDLENHSLEEFYSADSKVFRTLYSSEITNLNYLVASSAVDTAVCANVIDALVDYDEYGNIIPGLAKSWEANDDMTEWTFHLRDGITWVDYEGTYYADVVADDFVMAAEYVNNAANETDCQYMYSTGCKVTGAQEFYDYTSYLLHPSQYKTAPPEVKASDIGVEAVNDKTLVYHLDEPCSFFPSVLSYTTFLPICRKYLKETDSMFAKDYMNMLYNGAYILNYFRPTEKQVFVKNPTYWDKDNVFIDRIENTYDADAAAISPQQFLAGNVDSAVIKPEKLEEYMKDPAMADEIHRSRPDASFSYFYAFNFIPRFDERYEPENWAKAVVNKNFRRAVMAAINRKEIMAIYEPYDPESLISNTVTPVGAAVVDGMDYTRIGGLAYISGRDSYDVKEALDFRNAAKEQLEREGVTFPIKVLMPYNPSNVGWEQEAYLLEKQLEGLLGKDFIDVIVEAGSDTGFLLSVRRSGKYAFMKCRWGADYADPQTWTEPFEDDGEYMFWHECEDRKVKNVHKMWKMRIEKASSISDDILARYTAFADAETLVINQAIVVPLSIMNGDGYIMSRIDEFEGEYSSYGMARQRYKRYKLHEDSMNMQEFDQKYKEWLEKVSG